MKELQIIADREQSKLVGWRMSRAGEAALQRRIMGYFPEKHFIKTQSTKLGIRLFKNQKHYLT